MAVEGSTVGRARLGTLPITANAEDGGLLVSLSLPLSLSLRLQTLSLLSLSFYELATSHIC